MQLNDTQARVLMALAQERERAEAAMVAYMQFLAPEMAQPRVQQTPQGLMLVDVGKVEEEIDCEAKDM